MAPKKRNPKAPKRFQKRKAPKSKAPSAKMASLVKTVLNRQVETKSTGNDPVAYTFNAITLNGTMSPAIDLSTALDISQGTSDGARIGNKINVSYAMLKFHLRAVDANTPSIISIYIGYRKEFRNTVPTAGQLTQIFNDGAASSGHDGTSALNLLRNINTDAFTIVKRFDIKLGFSTPATYSNNDFPVFVNKKVRLPSLEGICQYTQDGTATAHNKQLYMFCQYTAVNASYSVNVNPPILQYYMSLQYKDI